MNKIFGWACGCIPISSSLNPTLISGNEANQLERSLDCDTEDKNGNAVDPSETPVETYLAVKPLTKTFNEKFEDKKMPEERRETTLIIMLYLIQVLKICVICNTEVIMKGRS